MATSSKEGIERLRITAPDLIPAGRYYDPAFAQAEEERLWFRMWQMACRLEEIPEPGDFVEYQILGRSVMVVRQKDGAVRAFENACRHRGAKLCQDRGSAPGGFSCPFHAWQYNIDGTCKAVLQPALFRPEVLAPEEIDLPEVRCETWANCAFITFAAETPPLRECLGAFGRTGDERRFDQLRAKAWIAIKVPCNWKMAVEAFLESYHVPRTHPQLVSMLKVNYEDYNRLAQAGGDGNMDMRMAVAAGSGSELIDRQVAFYKVLAEGMGNTMVSERELAAMDRIAAQVELPADQDEAMQVWRSAMHKAIYDDAVGAQIATWRVDQMPLTKNNMVHICFPNFFMLPPFTAAASYRIRPLGPEECLFEIWGLERFPDGVTPPKLPTPEPMLPGDPRIPAIPTQDFSNLPTQQLGIHSPSFEYLRVAEKNEGVVSNFERMVDGFVFGWDWPALIDGLGKTSGVIDQEIKPMGPAAC